QAATLLEQGLELARGHGDTLGIAYHLNGLGYLELLRSHPERAAARQRESVLVWHGLGDKFGVAQGLAGGACALAAPGRGERAARLLGAAESLEVAVHGAPTTGRPDRERALAAIRTSLGQEALAAALSEGRAMPPEQALDYALAEPEPQPAAVAKPGGPARP